MNPEPVNTTYKIFISNFRNQRFTAAGGMMFDILSILLKDASPLSPSWQQELPNMVAFLHRMDFTFNTADDFYEMLATIALRIKQDPQTNWRAILDSSLS